MSLPPPVLIPAFNPGSMTGSGNNTYLFPDRDALLIDAGTGDSRHIAAIEAALASNAGRLTDVLVTHAHPDHASGAGALRRAWPAARFWKFPWPEEDRRLNVEFGALSDRQWIGTSGAIDVIHTPGHSPDHCCFWLASQAILFCGDLLIQGGTVVIPGSRGGNMTAYLDSLQRVGGLDPRRVLPAHGQAIEQPLELIQTYLAHRREREAQILTAMTDGHSTVETLTACIYDAVPPSLTRAARDTVLAHLIKLETEGRAELIDGHWRRTAAAAKSFS